MSCVVVITPVLIASWPVMSAAVTAAVGSLGFAIVRNASASQAVQSTAKTRTKAEIEVADSEILQEAASSQTIVVEREGIKATFSRDARGSLKVCLDGEGYSKAELKRVGEELVERVTQQYVYHRVVTELKERKMNIVEEEVAADRTVTIRVRNL
jgi:Protein of unknown function (DUF1257)